ncbi:MAG: GNAT family N-acetyltransferase [Candidatus Rokubacteria bacterium]|nr:GNAT family N-acetyltransferase [Candidatus Rokubacteria bacterium]
MGDPDGYPHELVHEVVLRDATRVVVRPIRPDDAGQLVALYGRLSRHTAYQRFFTVMKRLPPDWAALLATVDYQRRLALVAEHHGEVVSVARWEPTERDDTVEVAFVVQDGWQNRGLGTRLFLDLLAAARARGHARFVAYVLGDNTRMLDLIRRFTHVEQRLVESGVVEVLFTLPTP